MYKMQLIIGNIKPDVPKPVWSHSLWSLTCRVAPAAHQHCSSANQAWCLSPIKPCWTVTSRCSPYISLYALCLLFVSAQNSQHLRPIIEPDDRVQYPPMPFITSPLHKPCALQETPTIVGQAAITVRHTSCCYTTVQLGRSKWAKPQPNSGIWEYSSFLH